ncbi:MAG: hypothetical protein V7676_12215 [Parasphingorhabdus sp.]|uniref:hypothetical protein n=1 Tax=Parasphingorhabdus sp. TaxID=2709688 RepID=UPI0030028EC0
MTSDLVSRLEQGIEDLVSALDGHDPDRIVVAASALQPIIAEMTKAGVWHESTALRNQLLVIAKRIEGARFRVNKLTDLNQLRAINLSHALGSTKSTIYKK